MTEFEGRLLDSLKDRDHGIRRYREWLRASILNQREFRKAARQDDVRARHEDQEKALSRALVTLDALLADGRKDTLLVDLPTDRPPDLSDNNA